MHHKFSKKPHRPCFRSAGSFGQADVMVTTFGGEDREAMEPGRSMLGFWVHSGGGVVISNSVVPSQVGQLRWTAEQSFVLPNIEPLDPFGSAYLGSQS